jgi:hypothetical protein
MSSVRLRPDSGSWFESGKMHTHSSRYSPTCSACRFMFATRAKPVTAAGGRGRFGRLRQELSAA